MVPTKLLIAVAADTDVQSIADDLRRAGLRSDVHATVLSVADLLPIPAGAERAALPAAARRARERTARGLEEAQRVAADAAGVLRAAFPSWVIDAEAQADAPAWAIVKRADHWHPDLIVLCAHERSALQRIALGSVSQSVLTHASGSVRIVRRPRAEPAGPPSLVVGIDGSPAAEAVAAAVAERAWPAGSTALLLSVFDPTLANMLGFTDDSGDECDAAARLASRAAAALGTAGLAVSSLVIEGNPKQVLVEQAEARGASCLVVGARGLRAVDRLLLGSVSASVAAHAHCTVEVVRR